MDFNQSDRCEHFSCPERSGSPAVYILLYVCSAAVVLLTVCGNLLVIISVLHFKKLHTPTNLHVLSLAVLDFLTGALAMPAVLIWTIESCWILGRGFCISVWLLNGFLWTLSFYTIALISVDRYLALSNPFFYANKITWRTTCILIFTNWCVCLAYVIAFCYFSGTFMNLVMCPGECFFSVSEIWFITDIVVVFIFPCSIIVILYTRVFVIAKKHATAIRELNNHSMKSERKAAKVLAILVFVFMVFLLPYFVYNLLGDFIEVRIETSLILLIMFCLNSTVNPFIYALFYSWFRRCIKLIITLRIFQTDSSLINVLS